MEIRGAKEQGHKPQCSDDENYTKHIGNLKSLTGCTQTTVSQTNIYSDMK